jgi:hypothetical protein
VSDDETVQIRLPDAVIEDALAGIFDELASLPSNPKTRELQTRAESYRRALAQWGHAPPSHAQRGALRDLVIELHAKVRGLRGSADLGLTPMVGVPAARTPTAPPSSRTKR